MDLQQKLLEWAQSIVDIASEEIPQFAHEIIAYKTWSAEIWFYGALTGLVLCVLLFALFLITFITCDKNHYTSENHGSACVAFFFATAATAAFTLNTYTDVKKCQVAPRMVLLDHVRGMK